MKNNSIKIGVVGIGRIGLPTALCIANSGLETIGIDIDENLVSMINSKDYPLKDEPEFDKIFKNVISQIPQKQQVIPAMKNDLSSKDLPTSYEFEPEEDEILDDLLPKNISTQIHKAFLENSASEQGSRMTAMDSATRNAGDLVDKLTITYNRSRQAAITKELIEIISGAESL